jgi:hypothetical protein
LTPDWLQVGDAAGYRVYRAGLDEHLLDLQGEDTAIDEVTVVPARRLPDLLQALPPILGPERVAWLADRARLRFGSAA